MTGWTVEWVYLDLLYADETFGQSRIMSRWEAQWELHRMAGVPYYGDKRVQSAMIVPLDPQPVQVQMRMGLA